MQNTSARTFLFVNATIVAVLVALGVYQVSQPLRGVLVLGLFVVASFGSLIVKVLRHHYAYKTAQAAKPPTRTTRRRRPRRSAHRAPRVGHLRVVVSDTYSGTRRTIR